MSESSLAMEGIASLKAAEMKRPHSSFPAIVLVLVVVIVIDVFGCEPRTPSLPSFVRVSSFIASRSYRQRSKIDNEHDHDNEHD